MDDAKYTKLLAYPKILNQKAIVCANQGKQTAFKGHAITKAIEKFTVIQVRKGHLHKDDLTYVLSHVRDGIMLRIDIHGAPHNGLSTPHVHIYDNVHKNGAVAIPLEDLKNYDPTDDIVESLVAFLDYTNFAHDKTTITEQLLIG
ncbi:MAG TPA: hypothetical protein DCW31_11550 [Lactobacillus sp.]|nr:hypothetical protein [Lactobacillus sp.]